MCGLSLSLPFGFLASPSYFPLATLVATPVHRIHQSFRSIGEPGRILAPYTAFLYIEGGIFAETDI